jgi:hypothetical protein
MFVTLELMMSRIFCCLTALVLVLGGCAAPAPLPFRLIDSDNAAFHGFFRIENQSMEVRIGETLYQGFYIVATSVEHTTLSSSRFGKLPRDSVTVASSNSARAHLVAQNGLRLACEFIFEAQRAIGECKSPPGKTYELVADAEPRR